MDVGGAHATVYLLVFLIRKTFKGWACRSMDREMAHRTGSPGPHLQLLSMGMLGDLVHDVNSVSYEVEAERSGGHYLLQGVQGQIKIHETPVSKK